MYAKIMNPSADLNNLNKNDLEFTMTPKRLVDSNGIQYPISVLRSFTKENVYNLFGYLECNINDDYDMSTYDDELHDVYISHYYVSDYVLYENRRLQDKSQNIIDEVLNRRVFETSIEYRKLRKEAYINELSPERDPITALGDVVDALYQAIYHGEIEKLNELAIRIEDIKQRYPKPVPPSANTVPPSANTP